MIKIIDSIMGSGKTEWAIKYMKEHPEKKYIYITPFLAEVQRIKSNCVDFEEPDEYTEYGEKCLKLESFHKLLKQGKNIASTHSLFKLTTEETVGYLRKWNYTLFLDEVLQAVETDTINSTDLEECLKLGHAKIDETTKYLIWLNNQYAGDAFKNLMIMSKTKSVFIMGEGKKKNTLIWIFPALIFNHFDNVFVLTYLSDYQPLRYYFDMNGFSFEKYRISNYQLVPHDNFVDDTSKIRINIYSGKKNDIGEEGKRGQDKQTCLCAGWYDRATNEQFDRLRKNIYGYFNNDLKSPSDLNLWTCFKGPKIKDNVYKYQIQLMDDGYRKGFLACNARATNDYRHKTAIVYPINIYLNPVIINFFIIHGIKISKSNVDQYALSEMLQFLWRSALRDGKEVNLYIPSCRMRRILKEWLGVPK